MSVECFLDTNILVYAASTAPEDAGKQRVALELVRNENFGISTQVLQEFYVTVTRRCADRSNRRKRWPCSICTEASPSR